MDAFITQEEFVALNNGELGIQDLNDILIRVYNKAVDDALIRIPHILARLLVNQAAINGIVVEFADRHKDMLSTKEDIITFQDISNEVETEFPGWDYPEVLEEAASRFEARRNAIKIAEQIDVESDEEPSLKLLDEPAGAV